MRAGFEAHWGRGRWPVAPLITHGSIAAVFALIVAGSLTPYSYTLFLLGLASALLALPLLGDFSSLLRADPAREWVETLPVTRIELRVARTLVALTLVAALALSALIPAALFAPEAMGAGARVLFVASGLGQALVVTALLLGLQALLGRRAEALLVAAQTVLVAVVVVGCVVGLRLAAQLRGVDGPAELPAGIAFLPASWFAAPFASDASDGWLASASVAVVVSLAVLVLAPQPETTTGRRGGWLGFVLAPLRRLATRVWVKREERGSFDLVFDALPLEREFVLRTYPMLGIPLAFLVAGARGEGGPAREGLLALLLFTPGIYLPVLVAHVVASESAAARWILDGAPVERASIEGGAIKAITVRFLVPLYVLLSVVAWSSGQHEILLRLGPLSFLVTLAVLRGLYGHLVADPPLSVHPSEIRAPIDWTGPLMTIGIALTLVSIVAWRVVDTPAIALVVTLVLLAVELRHDVLRPRASRSHS